jgi:hypothetical protein
VTGRVSLSVTVTVSRQRHFAFSFRSLVTCSQHGAVCAGSFFYRYVVGIRGGGVRRGAVGVPCHPRTGRDPRELRTRISSKAKLKG